MAGTDREKALDAALAQIERQFGKGSAMRLGDTVREPVEVIPTGSTALDVALGIGGLPRGRVVEVYGPESSGKCLTGDTYVWSAHGLETIREVFERCGQRASTTSRVTDVTDLDLRVVNERGELEKVAALTHNNRRPVVKLRLKSGRSISVTRNHPLRVVSRNGFIVWRRADRIAVGDTVVSALFGAVEAAEGHGISEDEAVFLGYLVAEGSLSYDSSIRFTHGDPEASAECIALAGSVLGEDVRVKNYYDKEFVIFSKALRTHLVDRYGMDFVTAHGKTVPHCVRTAGPKMQRAFLSALFEGDGWIDPSSTVGLGTASEQLAREVQLLLYGLGIPCTISAEYSEKYERDYWSVAINPAVADRFFEEIGFRSARRREQVSKNFRRSSRDPQFENIPHVAGMIRDLRDDCGGDREFDRIAGDLFRAGLDLDVSRTRLQRLVTWCENRLHDLPPTSRAIYEYLRVLAASDYTYEQVVAVDDAGEQPTFDIMVPQTHSFVANGIISHNTTIALHAVANAQKAGGTVAFVDAEHALDPEYAKKLGVDTDALVVSQPDTGEQALEITDMLIRSGALDLIVIDSVAALVPRAEIEGEMGDSHVGLQARLMSQALRKITGALNQSKTTAIFINQLREKVGVMFGCGSYDTRVTLADGSQERLGKIVDQKMDVEVLAYDPDLNKIVPRKVVGWFNNGRADEFLEFVVERAGGGTGRGRARLAMTRNHLIRTPGGWREAEEIIAGDRVMLAQPHRLSPQQWQIILGALLGDGCLSAPVRVEDASARFRMGHGRKQAAYLDWKLSMLGNIEHSRHANVKGAVFADFTPLAELGELREVVYFGDGKKHISSEYLKVLTPLALAIWYMDDGGFSPRSKGVQARTEGGSGRIEICVEALSEGSRERLRGYLRDTYGLNIRLRRAGARQTAVLVFDTASSAKFHEIVAPYVHPSMDYKLLPRYRGMFSVVPQFTEPEMRLVPARVLAVQARSDYQKMSRFDIEIEGAHNYLADGVMVHNSPETTTGGRALKFYSSVRLDIRRIETLKDGTEAVGNRTRVKVVKNKCLAAGTKVFDPHTGLTHDIADIVDEQLPVHVAAMDKKGRFRIRPVVSWFDQGEQDVIGLRAGGGAEIWLTPDHKVLTETGWVMAGELQPGDVVARPREAWGFGDREPVPAAHARLLGYLIGDGYVGGKTPVAFINAEEALHDDAAKIAGDLGCDAKRKDGLQVSFSHRAGEKNGVLELCRRAGVWGHLAWEKRIPAEFFEPDVSAGVVSNLLFGLFESDGWVSKEQTGAIRVGFATTSEQLAHQIHWLLLRWGIVSSVRRRSPRDQRGGVVRGRRNQAKRPCWEIRVAGSDNVGAFVRAIPMWGPRGTVLTSEVEAENGRRRGGQRVYLSQEWTAPVLAHLDNRGLSPDEAAHLVGESAGDPRGGMKQVLGTPRVRRDRLAALAEALDDAFLQDVLAEQLMFATVREVLPMQRRRTFDVEVEEHHNLVADGIVVHNCAPPFKQAEFDILYGVGISREGGLIDMGVEHGFIRKSGAWYTYEGDQLGQGKENARNFLRDNPDLADEIEKKIKEKLGIGPKVDAPAAETADDKDAAGGPAAAAKGGAKSATKAAPAAKS